MKLPPQSRKIRSLKSVMALVLNDFTKAGRLNRYRFAWSIRDNHFCPKRLDARNPRELVPLVSDRDFQSFEVSGGWSANPEVMNILVLSFVESFELAACLETHSRHDEEEKRQQSHTLKIRPCCSGEFFDPGDCDQISSQCLPQRPKALFLRVRHCGCEWPDRSWRRRFCRRRSCLSLSP